jgi:hypothetical protein
MKHTLSFQLFHDQINVARCIEEIKMGKPTYYSTESKQIKDKIIALNDYF